MQHKKAKARTVWIHSPAQIQHQPLSLMPAHCTKVSSILISIENELTRLDARIALIEELYREFQAMRQSL